MPAALYNILIEQGATFSATLEYRDSEYALIDLSGYTARMQIRETINATEFLIEATTGNSMITLGGALGTILIEIPAEDTAALTVTRAVYDLEIIDGDDKVTRIIKGTVQVDKEVTR